ncbi:MAG: hypothetical protein MSA55_06200 [Coriobacteriaceae bacterium]|nr:hypothetical protein [Coriobacteriaceae bacterium]
MSLLLKAVIGAAAYKMTKTVKERNEEIVAEMVLPYQLSVEDASESSEGFCYYAKDASGVRVFKAANSGKHGIESCQLCIPKQGNFGHVSLMKTRSLKREFKINIDGKVPIKLLASSSGDWLADQFSKDIVVDPFGWTLVKEKTGFAQSRWVVRRRGVTIIILTKGFGRFTVECVAKEHLPIGFAIGVCLFGLREREDPEVAKQRQYEYEKRSKREKKKDRKEEKRERKAEKKEEKREEKAERKKKRKEESYYDEIW